MRRSRLKSGAIHGALRAAPYGLILGALTSGLAAVAEIDSYSAVLLGMAAFGSLTAAGTIHGMSNAARR